MSLLVTSTVALAQDPTPEPVSTPVPAVTAAPTPAPTVLGTPTPVATAALTPEASVTAVPTPSPTASVTATATATAAPQRPQPPRQAATPTPTATATATVAPGGATLTLCHALNEGGLYETVTLTKDELLAGEHFDHDADIIPAPATGCAAGAQPDELVGVCHATGDPEQPYVFAGFKEPSDLDGHENHDGDLIPAPNATCPGLSEYFVPTPTPTPTPEPSVTAAPTQVETATPTAEPTAEVVDEDTDGGRTGGAPSNAVAGTSSKSGGTATATATYLPFTGFELWLIAAAGLGLTLMGAGLRLVAAQPAVGVTR